VAPAGGGGTIGPAAFAAGLGREQAPSSANQLREAERREIMKRSG